MEYITSRGFILPEFAGDLADGFWFNLWRRKLWPYKEIVAGDTLYWYESPTKKIVWKTRITEVERFFYDNKKTVVKRLKARFGNLDTTQTYFVEMPEPGYCLAWKVAPLQRMNLPKPDTLRFPRQGWLRVDDNIASTWLNQPGLKDDTTLDDIVPNGPLLERLNRLNTMMAEVTPERVRSMIARTVRRDTQLVKALKELCEFRCQFPGCGVRIPKRDGGFYIEVAHIQPVSQGGQSVLGNLLVLCPNHHKEFDFGNVEIVEQTIDGIKGTLNGKWFEISFPGGIATESVRRRD